MSHLLATGGILVLELFVCAQSYTECVLAQYLTNHLWVFQQIYNLWCKWGRGWTYYVLKSKVSVRLNTLSY